MYDDGTKRGWWYYMGWDVKNAWMQSVLPGVRRACELFEAVLGPCRSTPPPPAQFCGVQHDVRGSAA
jgi:hypothetical protein